MAGIENMTAEQIQNVLNQKNDLIRRLSQDRDELYSSLHETALELQQTRQFLARANVKVMHLEVQRDYYKGSNSIFETKLHNIGAVVDSYFNQGTNPRLKLMEIRDICD